MSFMTQRARRGGQVWAVDGQAEEGFCLDVLNWNIRELDIRVWKSSLEVRSPNAPVALGPGLQEGLGMAERMWARWLPAKCDFRRLPSNCFPETPPSSACISLKKFNLTLSISIFKSE